MTGYSGQMKNIGKSMQLFQEFYVTAQVYEMCERVPDQKKAMEQYKKRSGVGAGKNQQMKDAQMDHTV